MTTIRDNAAAERPNTSSPRGSSEPPTPWRGSEFQALLQQAAERREPLFRQTGRAERDKETERDEDDGKVDLSALLGPARDFQDVAGGQEASGVDALSALAKSGGNAVEAPVSSPGATVADIEAFTAAMDKAWLASGGDRKALALGVADKASLLTGLGLSRAPDGSLSLTLAARPDATPELTKALETLRKRLEVRGLALADLFVEADDGLDPESLIRRVR
ncbi:hypothetical protein SGCZBJ_07855 [Caulobacter zeae]|uniref:Flagellar hook-length control protein FliK n=1 Tax=Caulobacter zeae TaxID=2055137 RepID=A0A2N5DML2_9CAUL|nr:hypothetical protein [Caulobacter zeae]PLR27303.1 hypothetical protein SGCZBJ_07855 [Caulobacter zeae]